MLTFTNDRFKMLTNSPTGKKGLFVKACLDCKPYPPEHIEHWFDDVIGLIVSPVFEPFLSAKFLHRSEKAINDIFIKLGLLSPEKNFALSDINSVSATFIATAKEKGLEFRALRTPFGYSRYFRMRVHNQEFDFEVLPRALMMEKKNFSRFSDDKWVVKRELGKLGLPYFPGRAFWWFQKARAVRWTNSFGYPVILKPRRGSLSQHVYYNIQNEDQLAAAITQTRSYSPVFIIERFVPNLTLYRVTVIDGERLFISKRTPAKVVGDGESAVRELTLRAGLDEGRLDRETIKSQGFTLNSVPRAGEKVYLHNKIILSLGAEFEEIKLPIHEDNERMFRAIAGHFGNLLVGIDFLGEDIIKSWREQKCAILELNSMPNIKMHSFADENGQVKNKVAEAIVDLVLKYYK